MITDIVKIQTKSQNTLKFFITNVCQLSIPQQFPINLLPTTQQDGRCQPSIFEYPNQLHSKFCYVLNVIIPTSQKTKPNPKTNHVKPN